MEPENTQIKPTKRALKELCRPLLMLAITAILVNTYILLPYLSALSGISSAAFELPDTFWNLATLITTSFIVGRSTEKGISKWKGAPPQGAPK